MACTFVNNLSAYVDRPLCTVPMILLQCYCNCLSIISKFPDLTSFSITTKDADESNGSDGSDSDGSDSEGNSDDNNGNNDSDDGDLNGGNGRDRRKEKSGSVFESEEAFERMMKRAIEKAVFALQVKKKPKHGNNERVARKKATQKEKIQEDKSERAQFCVSNI